MSDASADRKRLRDRRSQQTLRDKKARHIAKLEEQVAHCEQHHNDRAVERLLQTIKGLRMQNETLRLRQTRLRSLVNSWDESLDVAEPAAFYKKAAEDNASQLHPQESLCNGMTSSTGADTIISPSFQPSPTTTPHPLMTSVEIPTGNDSPWNQIPLHSDDLSNPKMLSLWWLAYPEQIIPCPNTPSSPLDILYGTKTNPLADMIHTGLQRRPIRDPERLGLGWLAYHLTRWIISPSPETYDRLPTFLRPTEDQIQVKHPVSVDNVPWPKMRQNMIHRWHVYAEHRDELFGMMACCVKLRWPWGVDILERNAENELCIKPKFYETFMNLQGWGLTPEFITQYPDLVAGMDMDSLVFTVL